MSTGYDVVRPSPGPRAPNEPSTQATVVVAGGLASLHAGNQGIRFHHEARNGKIQIRERLRFPIQPATACVRRDAVPLVTRRDAVARRWLLVSQEYERDSQLMFTMFPRRWL